MLFNGVRSKKKHTKKPQNRLYLQSTPLGRLVQCVAVKITCTMVGKAPALSTLYNNYLAFGQIVQVWAYWCVWFQQEYSYRSAVLDHGVLHLMTLGDATGEEAALANVIVEMFQTPISVEIKRSVEKRETEKRKKKRKESIKERNLQLCFLHGRSS